MSHRFAVLMLVESDDPALTPAALLDPDRLDTGIAIARALPDGIRRLVAVFPEEHADFLVLLHRKIMDAQPLDN